MQMDTVPPAKMMINAGFFVTGEHDAHLRKTICSEEYTLRDAPTFTLCR
jgi:hypothetical protein